VAVIALAPDSGHPENGHAHRLLLPAIIAPNVNRVTTRDQRLNEIDLDSYEAPKSIADLTDDDWKQAADALRAFEIERGIR